MIGISKTGCPWTYRACLILMCLTPLVLQNASAKDLFPAYGSMELDRNERGPFLSKKLRAAEEKLQMAYVKRLQTIPPDAPGLPPAATRKQLEKSQAAWLRYREENCALYGGSIAANMIDISTFMGHCQISETYARIDFLEKTGN